MSKRLTSQDRTYLDDIERVLSCLLQRTGHRHHPGIPTTGTVFINMVVGTRRCDYGDLRRLTAAPPAPPPAKILTTCNSLHLYGAVSIAGDSWYRGLIYRNTCPLPLHSNHLHTRPTTRTATMPPNAHAASFSMPPTVCQMPYGRRILTGQWTQDMAQAEERAPGHFSKQARGRRGNAAARFYLPPHSHRPAHHHHYHGTARTAPTSLPHLRAFHTCSAAKWLELPAFQPGHPDILVVHWVGRWTVRWTVSTDWMR